MDTTSPECLPSQQDYLHTSPRPLQTATAVDANFDLSTAMPAADRPKRSVKPVQAKSKAFSTTTSKSSTTKGSWANTKILTPASAIITPSVDIHAFLVTCISGFDSYSEEEKRGIIDSLPPAYRQYNIDTHGKLECPITVGFVMGDSFLKRAISKFKTDVDDGYYDPAWQTKARKAVQERREGKFDDYLKQHVEEMFGDGTTSQQSGSKEEGSVNGAEKGDMAEPSGVLPDRETSNDGGTGTSSDGEWVENKAEGRTRKRGAGKAPIV